MNDLDVTFIDEAVSVDQYYLTMSSIWRLGPISSVMNKREGNPIPRAVYLYEFEVDEWVPFVQMKDWLIDRRVTGRTHWILGSESDSLRQGFQMHSTSREIFGTFRAPHGRYGTAGRGIDALPREASWRSPTVEFVERVPRDPATLLSRLGAGSAGTQFDNAFSVAGDFLRSCRIPADLRQAVCFALLRDINVAFHEAEVNLAGRQCVAFSRQVGSRRDMILIDKASGQYAGDKSIVVDNGEIGGVPAGTIIGAQGSVAAVVDSLGEAPDCAVALAKSFGSP